MEQTTKKSAPAKVPAKKDAAKELQDLFEDSLKDIYWAEKALTKPRLRNAMPWKA